MPSQPPAITKYIDPLTDFGFKRLFGSDPNKDLLIDFLNSIFDQRKLIVHLEFNKNEHTADIKDEGSAIFDLTCTGKDGERFIIEVQRGKPSNFKKRAIYYTSLLAAGQAPKGGRASWAYDLPEIFFIALLEDFSVDSDNDGRYLRDICLADRHNGKVFYEGLGYIFLELVNFAKTEHELESNLDKWLYVLKNMSRMNKIPVFMRKTIFEKVFSIAEYSNMSKEEKTMYNTALKRKWDNHSVLEYAVKVAEEKGIEKGMGLGIEKGMGLGIEKGMGLGIEKGRKEEHAKAEAEKWASAKLLKQSGVQASEIAKALKLPLKEVELL